MPDNDQSIPQLQTGTAEKNPSPAAAFITVFRLQKPTTATRSISTSSPIRNNQHQRQQQQQQQLVRKQRLPVFHARRAHHKSRLGCGNCKRRRVKCDETKPHCTRCRKYGITCDYLDMQAHDAPWEERDSQPKGNSRSTGNSSVFTTMQSMTLTSIETTIDHTIQLDILDDPISGPFTNLETLHHFVTHSTENVASDAIRDVMRGEMIGLAFATPYLMHTILAVSLLHLNRLQPQTSQSRRLAEAYHWQRAIRLYQTAMQARISAHNMDPLLATCMLMSISTLCPEKFCPMDSFVFHIDTDSSALNWLALQGGLRCLIEMTAPFIADSIWRDTFADADRKMRPLDDDRCGREGLHQGLADLCAIDEFSTYASSVYLEPLRMLSPMLLHLVPHTDPENYSIFVSFMARISPAFIDLLRRRDVPALVILAYWMALMCEVSECQPWINVRIWPECVGVCMFLEHEYGWDDRVMALLEWPARTCGCWE